MMHTISTFAIGTIAILLTFGLAIFVHEFGHMMFALIRGVGVESFAIGMGPRMVSWKWGGIDFSFRWFPVGGFVKLKGMIAEEPEEKTEPEPAAPESGIEGAAAAADQEKTLSESSYDDLLALRNKGLITKLMVFGGGVFMNYVTAVITMAIVLTMDTKVPVNIARVESVKPGSVAEKIGIRPQDQIVGIRVNDKATSITYDFDLYMAIKDLFPEAEANPAEHSVVGLQLRDPAGAVREVEWDVRHTTDSMYLDDTLGVALRLPPVVGRVMPTSPAWKAGVKDGDVIVAINDKPVNSFRDMQAIVTTNLAKEIHLKLKRGDEIVSKTLTPTDSVKAGEAMIGITSGSDAIKVIPGESLWTAVKSAPAKTTEHFFRVIKLQVDFFKEAGFKQVRDSVGGPVMIAVITADAAQRGLPDLLSWFITFNLLLLMLNVLPIPVLDGGFLLLSIIEAVIRRPVSPKILNPIYTFFMLFFIGLMLIITFWDVKRFLF